VPADHGNDEGFFGERVASRYDQDAAGMFDPAVVTPVVDTLAELAGQGAALEFGIGTGRIALPLAERGVRVAGINKPGHPGRAGGVLPERRGPGQGVPYEFRYVWPSELDLMARLAGMRLRHRWAGWRREPFTNLSRAHVSVYQKP
jgi:hypothetical protein